MSVNYFKKYFEGVKIRMDVIRPQVESRTKEMASQLESITQTTVVFFDEHDLKRLSVCSFDASINIVNFTPYDFTGIQKLSGYEDKVFQSPDALDIAESTMYVYNNKFEVVEKIGKIGRPVTKVIGKGVVIIGAADFMSDLVDCVKMCEDYE